MACNTDTYQDLRLELLKNYTLVFVRINTSSETFMFRSVWEEITYYMQQLYKDIKVRWLTRNVYCLKRRKTIQNGSPIIPWSKLISTEKHDVYVSAHISSTLKFAYCKLAFIVFITCNRSLRKYHIYNWALISFQNHNVNKLVRST